MIRFGKGGGYSLHTTFSSGLERNTDTSIYYTLAWKGRVNSGYANGEFLFAIQYPTNLRCGGVYLNSGKLRITLDINYLTSYYVVSNFTFTVGTQFCFAIKFLLSSNTVAPVIYINGVLGTLTKTGTFATITRSQIQTSLAWQSGGDGSNTCDSSVVYRAEWTRALSNEQLQEISYGKILPSQYAPTNWHHYITPKSPELLGAYRSYLTPAHGDYTSYLEVEPAGLTLQS